MNIEAFKIATDTATLCVFDVESLKARLRDDADWWTTTDAELHEVNAGNVVFLGLGFDGNYLIHLVGDLPNAQANVQFKVLSGRVFIGAGEEVSADGLEPECLRGGKFIDLPKGSYIVHASKEGSDIFVSIGLGGSGTNAFASPVRLK
jgi:Family of unknown function (DUF6386)